MKHVQNALESTGTGPALNAEQRVAVDHGEGPMLVVAGAGTGKTRVITERIANLLESHPELTGENILGLTFTNKAAGEMKHRVVRAAGERAGGVWLSTFHKFCLEKILRCADARIQPLEDIDHQILLRRNIAELGLVLFRRLAEPAEFLRDFGAFFSRCQDELVTPDGYQRFVERLRRRHEAQKRSFEPDALAIAEESVARQEELARVYRVSERLLRERNLCSFGGQLQRAVELLRTDEVLLSRMRDQYRYILVDEFQDTNIAQLELLWLLAGERRNIFVVGDDDQAIYRFRGASFGSFSIFLERFCGVGGKQSGADAKSFLVSLSENYRSTRRILRVASEVISHNNDKSPLLPPKQLTTENSEGEKIRVVEFATYEEEAYWVTSEIERLHDAGGPWKNFAVLYRKHAHRAAMLDALRQKGIPFVIRKFSILSSTLIRDLLAYLRLIALPSDNIACARVLAAPYWGLEPGDLVRLAERADKNHRRPLGDQLETAQHEAPWDRDGVRLEELVRLLGALRQSAKKRTACEILNELIAALSLALLPTQADRQYIERFAEFVKEWEKQSDRKSLRDFIEYLGYFEELNGDIHLEEEVADDAVQLMTVHGAKGLEFPHVFILRLAKGDFPSGQRKPVFEFPLELMKEEKPQGDFQIEEERRLFYVALTRAKRQLTLSTIVNKRKKPSPFLDDFLMNPQIQRLDAVQSAPTVQLPCVRQAVGTAPGSAGPAQLFGPAGENSRAFSRIALWAKAFHPPRPEPLQLSASAIDAYERCPMKYKFQYVWGIRSSASAALTFGRVMHTTIQEFVAEVQKRRQVPLEELHAIYDREWSSAGFSDDYHEGEYQKAGREQLTAFHGTYLASPADVLYQEKTFELALDGDVIVTGRMDQVNRTGKNTIEIVDYKTGRPRDEKKAAGDFQLSVYALAAREILDAVPERLVFYNLMTNEPVATTRDAKSLEKTKQKIAEVAGLIRAGEFSATPGHCCGYCDYKPLCPAHEQLISLPSAAPVISARPDRPAIHRAQTN